MTPSSWHSYKLCIIWEWKIWESKGYPIMHSQKKITNSLCQDKALGFRCNYKANDFAKVTVWLFNLELQFESVFNLEIQPKFGIQLGIPISMWIHLRECGLQNNWPSLVDNKLNDNSSCLTTFIFSGQCFFTCYHGSHTFHFPSTRKTSNWSIPAINNEWLVPANVMKKPNWS